MTVVTISDTDSQLNELLQRVLDGDEIIIEKRGKLVARLLPFDTPPARRVPGNDAGKVVIHANFDDPLPEFDA